MGIIAPWRPHPSVALKLATNLQRKQQAQAAQPRRRLERRAARRESAERETWKSGESIPVIFHHTTPSSHHQAEIKEINQAKTRFSNSKEFLRRLDACLFYGYGSCLIWLNQQPTEILDYQS